MAVEFFTVDAQLLRELGERLVGRPHIALAELIKNSYDADARNVEIIFSDNEIEILDDGHGMNREQFVDRWMRIGTTHKAKQRNSPELGRPLTGSKGVGRLSAQLLARELELESVALKDTKLAGSAIRRSSTATDSLVSASVNWDHAVSERDLTSVAVNVTTGGPAPRFAEGSNVGTRIVLRGLTSTWDAAKFRRLAREIWSLQPPFSVNEDAERAFTVTLASDIAEVETAFNEQMAAVLEIWSAKVVGRLRDDAGEDVAFELDRDARGAKVETGGPTRVLELSLDLRDNQSRTYLVRVPNAVVNDLDYEIRVFDLNNRQPNGVRVEDARGYLRDFGGVHIYDSGFRLPYYGPDEDWLGIETYHSHRLSRLRLLPSSLQAPDAANDIPTNNRLFGLAHVSTGTEAQNAVARGINPLDALTIQVTRDRLVDNDAFGLLRRLVGVGLDLYALERAKKRASAKFISAQLNTTREVRPSSSYSNALELIRSSRDALPPTTFEQVQQVLTSAVEDTRLLEQSTQAHSALLGALATAGMTALAYEHESSKQRALIARSAKTLRRIIPALSSAESGPVAQVAKQLEEWTSRADRLRGLFSPLLEEADRTEVVAYRASALVSDVAGNVEVLSRGTAISVEEVSGDVRLPPASYAAWTAVFQNLLINAFNATLNTPTRRVRVSIGATSKPGMHNDAWVKVEDTGTGVDLSVAERFFEPFERSGPVDIEAAALGLGGSGLGLTIVRMIVKEVGATAAFAVPSPDFRTCVEIRWRI